MLSVRTRRLPVSGNKRELWPSELLCLVGRRGPRQSRGCIFRNCIWSSDKCLENGLVTFQYHWAFCMFCMDNGIMNLKELIAMTNLYHVRNVAVLSSVTLEARLEGSLSDIATGMQRSRRGYIDWL